MPKKKDDKPKNQKTRKTCGTCHLWHEWNWSQDYNDSYGHCQLMPYAGILNHKDKECEFPKEYIKRL